MNRFPAVALRRSVDPARIAWERPDAPPGACCSYCAAPIGEDDIPLVLYRPDGSAARFCDPCIERCFRWTGEG